MTIDDFQLVRETLRVGDRSAAFWRVAEPDDVLDAAARARHDEPPYWATVWKSGRALAAWAGANLTPGQRVIDLGCGGGIVGCTALLAGARVTFADHEPPALELARRNAEACGGDHELRRVDWRADTLDGEFDAVLGGDVLYEPAMAEHVLAFCRRHAPRAVLADPNRRHADALAALVRHTGGTVTPFKGGRILDFET